MLYNEFLAGTGAKNTDFNYQVYKSLEALYMENDNMTKADVFYAGKKLIDNSPTEAEKEAEKEAEAMKAEARHYITESEENISYYKSRIADYKYYLENTAEATEKTKYRETIRSFKNQIKMERAWIAKQKLFIELA